MRDTRRNLGTEDVASTLVLGPNELFQSNHCSPAQHKGKTRGNLIRRQSQEGIFLEGVEGHLRYDARHDAQLSRIKAQSQSCSLWTGTALKKFLGFGPQIIPKSRSFPTPHLDTQLKSAVNRRHQRSGWRLAHGLSPPLDGRTQWIEPLDGLTPSSNFTTRVMHNIPKYNTLLDLLKSWRQKRKLDLSTLTFFVADPYMSTLTFYEG